jgi:hypothetical protein
MTTKTFAVLAAVLGLSSAVFAQSFDSSAADASALAQRARDSRHGYDVKGGASFSAQGAPAHYAYTILCAKPPKESELGDLRFYTGLAANPSKKSPTDNTAAGLDEYRSSYVRDGKWHYDAWSCDTQDYWFTFDAESLLKATAGEKSRSIKGHARIETRGQVDWEGDLDCVASW